jgi:5-methylcytosine-specific restriction endonuclease McrA
VKGCPVGWGLDYDHVVALADGGLTELENMWRLCKQHHFLKHHRGWRVVGQAHDWDLVPPDPPDDPDPP